MREEMRDEGTDVRGFSANNQEDLPQGVRQGKPRGREGVRAYS